MTAFRVLFVCIGNVCRSPLGERLLASKLPSGEFEVSSAGVGAMSGSPMTPEAAVHLTSYGGSADGFEARQLVPSMVTDSDLVQTAAEERSRAALDDYDIADPYGRGDQANQAAAESMKAAVERIAQGLVP